MANKTLILNVSDKMNLGNVEQDFGSMNRKLGVMMQREKDFGMRLMREEF